MGAWGFEPWQNDLAADWLAGLFAEGKIDPRVAAALKKRDGNEYWPEVRVAAHVLLALADVWPTGKFAGHCERAAERLEAVKRCDEFAGDAATAAHLDEQIAALRKAVKPKTIDPAKALAQLRDADPAARRAGLLWLGKYTHSVSALTDAWLADPATTLAHVPLLLDPDPDLAELAIVNITGIMFRHHTNPAVLPGAIHLLTSPRPLSRMLASQVAVQLGGAAALADVRPLFDDKDKGVRGRALKAVADHAADWPAAAKEQAATAARPRLADRADEVKYAAATALWTLTDTADLPAIKAAKNTVKSAGWKREFTDLIQRMQTR